MKTKKTIEIILKKYKIVKYTINNDESVNIDGDVYLNDRKFKELPVNFRKVTRYFYCDNCPYLSSLKGAPKEVGESFFCCDCSNLSSLKGAPEKVGGYFYCDNCPKLSSLQYAPLKCKIPNLEVYFLNGTKIDKIEADKYLLRRILLNDFSLIEEYSNKNKIKPLLVMKDFDLL